MAFGRKTTNRRRQTGSSLEVRMRTLGRRRRLRRVLAVLVLGAVAAYGLHHAGRYWPEFRDRQLLGDGLFALEEVQTFGPFRAVSRAELLLRAGVQPGQNLLALDLARVKRDVEAIPYVESAAVERVLPHVLRIRVTERRPLGRVRVYSVVDDRAEVGTLHYLDRHGVVMPALFNIAEPGDPFADWDLPLILGFNPLDIRPGDRARDPAVAWALTLVELYGRAPVRAQTGLRTVDVSERGTLRATLENGARVIFGTRELDRQLLRLGLLHELGAEHGQRLVEVDLSVRNNCPSLWTPATPAATTTAGAEPGVPFPQNDV